MLDVTIVEGLAFGAAGLCGLGVALAGRFTLGVMRRANGR
jgi:hypothetical protein